MQIFITLLKLLTLPFNAKFIKTSFYEGFAEIKIVSGQVSYRPIEFNGLKWINAGFGGTCYRPDLVSYQSQSAFLRVWNERKIR